jgi:TolB protein
MTRALVVLCSLLVGLVWASPAHATFPGANGKIAFFSNPGGNFDVYAIEPDGSGISRLTNDPAEDFDPAWSADGTKIAFASRRDGSSEIYTMNADGSGVERVTHHESDARGPAWSPDGTKIAFASGPDIYTINADGTGEARLTDSPEYFLVQADEWSPDGSRIVYTVGLPFRYSRPFLNTVKPDGTENYPLVDFGSSGTWSPDGTAIAYARPIVAGDIFSYEYDIYRKSTVGPDDTPLTSTDTSSESSPSWSPDGRSIAFFGGTDIYVMNADGSGARNLTNSAGFKFAPAWQPLPGPQRSDYKNAAHFCKALRAFLGDDAFRDKFGGGANAHGKCVGANH